MHLVMWNSKNALRVESRIYGSIGKERRRTYYIFPCQHEGCDCTWSATKHELNKRSGFCRRHSKRHSTKRQPLFWGHYKNLQYNARKYHPDKSFEITYEQFLFLTQIGVCYYCGEPNIVWDAESSNRKSNLDRKDNNKGYVFNNVVVCCKTCNLMKRDWFTADEFRAIRLLLKQWRDSSLLEKEEIMLMLSSWGANVSVLC